MYYKGPLFLSEASGKALSGGSDAKTTDYGDSCKYSSRIFDSIVIHQ